MNNMHVFYNDSMATTLAEGVVTHVDAVRGLSPPESSASSGHAAAGARRVSALLFALAAAVCFGAALVVAHLGLRHATPRWGAAISIAFTLLLWWPLSRLLVDWSEWQAGALAIFVLVGLFYPGIVMMLTYQSNRILGPTLTGAASSTTPVFAVASSLLLLGEYPAAQVTVGGAIVVAGLVMLSLKAPMRFAPGWHLVLPLSAAALRGIAQSLIKLGLLVWPSPFTAALMSYTTSAAVVWSAAAGRPGASRITKQGVLWFAGVGALNGTAVLLMCYALHHGSVGVVSPIIATYPLFTMVFSAALLKREELTWKSVAGAVLTVAGVTIVATGVG